MSRQELADACNAELATMYEAQGQRWAGLTDKKIGALERGEIRWPNEDYRRALCTVLKKNERSLGLYIDRPSEGARGNHAGTRRSSALLRDPTAAGAARPFAGRWVAEKYLPAPQVAELGEPSLVDLMLDQITAVAVACGLRPTAAATSRRRIALTDVARLKAITDLYWSVDREHGGGALCGQLAYVAEAATAWLDSGRTTVDAPARSYLASAVADVRLMAGWTAFDAGLYEDSQRHFVLAERASVHAADPLLAARVRYGQARQLQHRHHNIDALHTLQFAREDLGQAATPAVLTMLLGAEAASLAALGRRDDALRCLEQASDAFATIEPEREPTWMQFYDAGELFAQYGRVYRDLARQYRAQRRSHVPSPDPGYGAQAVHWVRQALARFDSGNVRSIVLNHVGLCSALMFADDPEQAVAAGTDLLAAAGNVSSRRLTERIHNLRRDFGPHQQRSDVTAFAHMITIGPAPR